MNINADKLIAAADYLEGFDFALLADVPTDSIRVKAVLQREVRILRDRANSGSLMELAKMPERQPLTSILGQKIEARQPIMPADVQPDDFEKKAFQDDFNATYASFLDTKDDKLIEKSRGNGGESIIRACAKKAGLPDWQDAKMNVAFIKAIKQAITDNATASDKIQDIKNATAKFDA